MRRPGHPGTAVRIGEDLFEIVAAEKSGAEWVYRLEPWTGRDTIRAYVEWGEESERKFTAGLRNGRIQRRKDFLAWAAQVFLGFLPAENQERLCRARGLDPTRATFWSAALETAAAFPFAFVFIINMAAGGIGGWWGSLPTWAGLLALAVTADGVFRLVAVISTGEPIGSVFLSPLGLRGKPEGPRYDTGDEISAIEGVLNVVSPVPKIWWERAGGVTYEGEPYYLAGSDRVQADFHYRFRRGGEGFPVLDPELEKLRNRSSDLSYVFAPLWGFLPSCLQKSLEFYGRFKPRPYIVLSIGFNVLVALALIGPGLRNVSLGIIEVWSLIKLAFALVLLAEGLLRLLLLVKDRRASGSLLAFLVKPFYNLAFKDKPVPPREAGQI
jgi:hypothetical protein